MTQAFVPDPDTDRHPQDINVITDIPEHGDEIVYGTDHASVTHSPLDHETVFSEEPGRFMTRRLPRKPAIGNSRMFTRNVFNDGNPVMLLSQNINRHRAIVWVNANGVASIGTTPGIGVPLPATGFPIILESDEAYYVWSNALTPVFVIEEEYL